MRFVVGLVAGMAVGVVAARVAGRRSASSAPTAVAPGGTPDLGPGRVAVDVSAVPADPA